MGDPVDRRSPEGTVAGLVDAVGVVARAAADALDRLGAVPPQVLDALADLRAELSFAALLAPRPLPLRACGPCRDAGHRPPPPPDWYDEADHGCACCAAGHGTPPAHADPRCAGCDPSRDRYRRDCPRHGAGTTFAAFQPDWRATPTGAPPGGWWNPAPGPGAFGGPLPTGAARRFA